jgi:phenylacetate-CoA ligase
MQFKELGSNYLITLHTEESNDAMTVEVSWAQVSTTTLPCCNGLTKNIARALHDEILLTPYVKLLPQGTLPTSDGKAVRVVDRRAFLDNPSVQLPNK